MHFTFDIKIAWSGFSTSRLRYIQVRPVSIWFGDTFCFSHSWRERDRRDSVFLANCLHWNAVFLLFTCTEYLLSENNSSVLFIVTEEEEHCVGRSTIPWALTLTLKFLVKCLYILADTRSVNFNLTHSYCSHFPSKQNRGQFDNGQDIRPRFFMWHQETDIEFSIRRPFRRRLYASTIVTSKIKRDTVICVSCLFRTLLKFRKNNLKWRPLFGFHISRVLKLITN